MRINVYSQELILGDPVGAVEAGTQKSNTDVEYSYVRLFLHSSDRLHHPPLDDDRSAITFWLPKSDNKRWALKCLLLQMAELVQAAPPETGLD